MWIGGFTDVLDSGSNGFGLYSANLNALINPYEYSSFFPGMGMRSGQYEGFAYLGLGMIVLCAIGIGLLIRRMIQMHKEKKLWIRMKQFIKKHASGLVSLSIVVIVFGTLALTTWVYIGKHIILQVYLPQFCYDGSCYCTFFRTFYLGDHVYGDDFWLIYGSKNDSQ